MSSEQKLTQGQELVALRSGRSLPDLLHEMRVTRAMTLADMGYELRVTPVTVAMWLRQFNITRDDGGRVETAS